jgi:hypothetical protein
MIEVGYPPEKVVSATELARRMGRLLAELMDRREPLGLHHHGRLVAVVVPLAEAPRVWPVRVLEPADETPEPAPASSEDEGAEEAVERALARLDEPARRLLLAIARSAPAPCSPGEAGLPGAETSRSMSRLELAGLARWPSPAGGGLVLTPLGRRVAGRLGQDGSPSAN